MEKSHEKAMTKIWCWGRDHEPNKNTCFDDTSAPTISPLFHVPSFRCCFLVFSVLSFSFLLFLCFGIMLERNTLKRVQLGNNDYSQAAPKAQKWHSVIFFIRLNIPDRITKSCRNQNCIRKHQEVVISALKSTEPWRVADVLQGVTEDMKNEKAFVTPSVRVSVRALFCSLACSVACPLICHP